MVWMFAGVVSAYLVGSIPTGYWFAKALRGIDIRQQGSGNIGASNVGRVMGKTWGVAVLIFDIVKGTFAVVLGQKLFYSAGGYLSLDLYKILCAAAVVCGHNWTVFLGFKGGKGVATSAGALLGLSPLLFVACAAVWIVFAKFFGYISVASMAAAVGFFVMTFVFKTTVEMKIFGAVMAVVLIVKHRENIRRLLGRAEPKIGESLGKGENRE